MRLAYAIATQHASLKAVGASEEGVGLHTLPAGAFSFEVSYGIETRGF